jgi:GNAT superfamily N-acetyltransferase
MKIIRASEKHLAELAVLQRMYMEHHARLDDYFTFEEDISAIWIDHMKKFLRQKNNIVLAAVEDEKIIGYMTASIATRPPIYKTKKIGLIGDNFVLPQHRRRGVLSKMLDETLAWMKARGIEYAEHPIAAKNRLGRTVWKKRGFEAATIFTRWKITQE